MLVNNPHPSPARPGVRTAGIAAVEFALLAGVFFTFIFGIIEIGRLMFVYGTLQEVTRRAATAAANVYPSDQAAVNKIRQDAIFRSSPGELVLAAPVSDANIRIEYLALTRDPNSGETTLVTLANNSLPGSAAQNRQNCMRNPNAMDCIRFVQVSICDNASTASCLPVRSSTMLPLVDFRVPLHKATTIATVESFGYSPGTVP